MLREAVEQAGGRRDVRDAVEGVYAQLQREIDLRKPMCSASGRCCRFDEFGHRLYVTTLELAAFVGSLQSTHRSDAACPFQVDGLCSVHAIRPFGCRVFFCDSTSDAWQHEQYERFHGELKKLHLELGVPYFYVEWRRALAEVGLGCETASGKPEKRLSLPQVRF